MDSASKYIRNEPQTPLKPTLNQYLFGDAVNA